MDELIAALERKARARAEEIVAEARAEAERIRAETEAEVERRVSPDLAEREAAWRAGATRAIGAAHRDGARVALRARARALERVFARARERLGAASAGPAYQAGLPDRLERALTYPSGRATVVCPPALADAIRDALGTDGAGVEVESDEESDPGFRVRAADGSVEVDETLTGRLDRSRPALAIHVVRAFEAKR